MTTLDSVDRYPEIRALILSKPALRAWYLEAYLLYMECLQRCPAAGVALEIGSGGGFAKEIVPELETSDILPYGGVDRVVDACNLPYGASALRAIFLLNTFHHVPDVEALLGEAQRCLQPGGRMLVVDQNYGWISGPILKYLHHEPFDPWAQDWKFQSSGPLTGANGALAWIVFVRDRERFARIFPGLRIVSSRTHSPLRYWLAGGLRSWSLLPSWAFAAATRLDRWLTRLSPRFGSFLSIEIERV